MLPLHHSHHVKSGDDRTRTGDLSPDKRVLLPLSYAPVWRGWDSNPRSRAHEAREDSRSSTALRKKVWPAGVEPAVSGAQNRRGGRLPHSQTNENPRRDSNPPFRVESPVSSPIDHGGRRKLRRQGSNLRLAINSRVSCRLDYTGTNGGSRIRTCGRAPHVYALATRRLQPLGHASRAEGEGVEPPRPRSPPVFETGYRTHGSPSQREWPRQESNLHHTD